jgi:hypothetical protein
MSRQSDFDLLPVLIIVGVAFLLINFLKPKTTPSGSLEVTGIRYGGKPSAHNPYYAQAPTSGFWEIDYVKWVQEVLNHITGSKLELTGIPDASTVTIIKQFQNTWGMMPSGALGFDFDQALRSALGLPGYV